MALETQIEAVRAAVSQAFVELGEDEAELIEAILLRDGYYAGRCFRRGALTAIWLAERPWITLRDAAGNDLRRLPTAATSARQRAA